MPSLASGRELTTLGKASPAAIEPWPGGGVWMEAVVTDEGGTWYGYYHNENPARVCGSEQKVIPRMGAATHLQQYVMLLNRAKDDNFAQDGIYVSFATDINDPRLWSAPVKVLNGGKWYPQVHRHAGRVWQRQGRG